MCKKSKNALKKIPAKIIKNINFSHFFEIKICNFHTFLFFYRRQQPYFSNGHKFLPHESKQDKTERKILSKKASQFELVFPPVLDKFASKNSDKNIPKRQKFQTFCLPKQQ
jgi:hypothetical protein